MKLPALYPIVDFACFAGRQDPQRTMLEFAEQLMGGGATIFQYRDKISVAQTFLANASELRRIARGRAMFVVNDRTDFALACDADGVHLGQDDLAPETARKILDSAEAQPHPFAANIDASPGLPGRRARFEKRIVGFSTHNLAQVREADSRPVDYIAIGPICATGSKANPDPVVGLEGVRAARAATTKPLVAIGGITRANCVEVRSAGADSVAVISDLLESPAKAVAAFLRVLG